MKPWPDRFPEHYRIHAGYWGSRGFAEQRPNPHEVRFTGTVAHDHRPRGGKSEHHEFTLEITYGASFPYEPPVVRFVEPEPKLKRSRHYLAGVPCLFRDDAWTTDAPPSAIRSALRRWLGGYLRGHWPNELPLYELPEYYGYSSPAVFYAPGALAAFVGQSGRFSVDELAGHDIAALHSVGGKQVGHGILGNIKPGASKPTRHLGRWYRLSAEPPPMRDLRDVRAVLRGDDHTYDLKRRPRPRELIGLVFSDRALGRERLLLLDCGVRASSKRREPVVTSWPVRAPAVYELSHEELFRRLEDIRDVENLSRRRVAVFGAGHIGSHAAEALVREGVGELELLDADRLAAGNIIRHALDLLTVGQRKAEALDSALARINPWLSTMVHTADLTDPGVLDAVIGRADVLLGAIGNDRRETYLCEAAAAHPRRPPIVIARTLHGGAATRLMMVRWGQDACMECLSEHRAQGHPDWIEVPADGRQEVFDSGCAAPARPGSGLSGQHAALLAARRVLDLLGGGDSDVNHWLWIDHPIAGDDDRLGRVGVLQTATFHPVPDCPVCGGV